MSSTETVADFSEATGKYFLATPTDGNSDMNEESGLWFIDNSTGTKEAGLTLPTLAAGWKYEGWVVINSIAVSTGTFTNPAVADDNASTSTFKGTESDGPAFPGEDFLQNAPENLGVDFPIDLRGKTVVVSVEPDPDNSTNPFTLKPLLQLIPTDLAIATSSSIAEGPKSSISGTVTR